MKNILCIILIVLTQLSVKAQTEKGRWNAGVRIGSFTYQKTEYGHYFEGSISPLVGYFVANNLLLGTGVPLGHISQNTTSSNFSQISKQTSIGLSPFARYYIGASKLKPYVGIAYTFSHTNFHGESSVNTPTETNSKSNTTLLTPSLGLAYFLSRTISLDAQLGYNWYNSKTTYNSATSDTPSYSYQNATLGIGFNIFFGS